jgi:hypothetical protein
VYQATVEDDIDSSVEGKACSDSNSHTQSFGEQVPRKQSSLPNTSRPVGKPSNSPPRNDTGPALKESSAIKRPARIRHENLHVHFSDRQPPQTYSNPKTNDVNNRDSSGKSHVADDSRPRQNSSRPRVSKGGTERSKLSAVDLRWGLLFSEEGKPTERLEQFLGGIAKHLVSFPRSPL